MPPRMKIQTWVDDAAVLAEEAEPRAERLGIPLHRPVRNGIREQWRFRISSVYPRIHEAEPQQVAMEGHVARTAYILKSPCKVLAPSN